MNQEVKSGPGMGEPHLFGGRDPAEGILKQHRIQDEMVEYSNGAYADHGSAKDQLERFYARAYADGKHVAGMKLDVIHGAIELLRDNGNFHMVRQLTEVYESLKQK